MLPAVSIEGSGIAASCCAHLLQHRGFRVNLAPNHPKAAGPTLLLNSQAQMLLADVFGSRIELLHGGTEVRRRCVLWGADEEVRTFPHSGTTVSEAELSAKLWERVSNDISMTSKPATWKIRSRFDARRGQRQCFGTRVARVVTAEMREESRDACFVEALAAGWLFLMPSGSGVGTLLAVGGNPEQLLGESRLVGKQVLGFNGTEVQFAAYPSMTDALCGPGWLACGSGAMTFDPICGEGVGHAAREAILAAAVIQQAVNDPASASAALEHYSERLLSGFIRHLRLCLNFYGAARCGVWWEREIAELERGVQWTQAQAQELGKPRYRLTGFELAAFS